MLMELFMFESSPFREVFTVDGSPMKKSLM